MDDAVNQQGPSLVDGARSPGDVGLDGDGNLGSAGAPTAGPAAGAIGPVGARLARWLWPARCLVCRDRGEDGLDLCHACTAGLPWLGAACCRCAIPLPLPTIASAEPGTIGATHCGHCLQQPPSLTEAHAACVYGAPLDGLLPRFKFHHDLAAGRLLAQLMAQAFAPLPRSWPQPAALLPIPLHPKRLRRRGYDQALELARPLARALDLPLLADALVRVRDTSPQSRLQATQRQRNLRDAFQADSSAALPAHVVLVDDVMTTGATLHAAALALQRAGVARVDAWVCARVP